jgi:hypothetical protein
MIESPISALTGNFPLKLTLLSSYFFSLPSILSIVSLIYAAKKKLKEEIKGERERS